MNEINKNKLSLYNYNLPAELIAQEPSAERDLSRLLVLNKATGNIEHRKFTNVIDYLNPGDCLVINKTKVVPVRVFGKKESGGKVEVLFINPTYNSPDNKHLALVKPFLLPGKKILLPGGVEAVVEGKTSLGETILSLSGGTLGEILDKHGYMPLPPYIKRKDIENFVIKDKDSMRYQTVYAAEKGSIAAPTAGLHFTESLLQQIKAKGIEIAEIILHVGWGTFKPIITENIAEHIMMPEKFEINNDACIKINKCIKAHGRIVSVGTTSVRSLESAASMVESFDKNNESSILIPVKGETSIFIYPGYKFKIVDVMITNFHLPGSTPLMMVSALAGRSKIFQAYEEAVKEKYRFYSYGDAMMIV